MARLVLTETKDHKAHRALTEKKAPKENRDPLEMMVAMGLME